MNAFFALLLVLTAGASVCLMLTLVPRGRPVLHGRGAVRAVGLGQLVVGLLWVAFGVAFLNQHGSHDARGWYVVVLGVLWAWQALRRLLSASRP